VSAIVRKSNNHALSCKYSTSAEQEGREGGVSPAIIAVKKAKNTSANY
jgi:hypothetical protein